MLKSKKCLKGLTLADFSYPGDWWLTLNGQTSKSVVKLNSKNSQPIFERLNKVLGLFLGSLGLVESYRTNLTSC